MTLPTSIWRCWENIVFGERQADDWTPYLVQPHFCKPKNGHKDCGPLRVAGPDDLLIRREVVEAWLRMANNGEIFDLEYHLERVLAAAEGETDEAS